jgi:hypothetical protein
MFEKFRFPAKPVEGEAKTKSSFSGTHDTEAGKQKYATPRRSDEAVTSYPVLSESFLSDKEKLIAEVKKEQLKALEKAKSEINPLQERHPEKILNNHEISYVVSDNLDERLATGGRFHRLARSYPDKKTFSDEWNFDYKDLAVLIERAADEPYLEYEAIRISEAQKYRDTGDSPSESISRALSHHNEGPLLKKDIERGLRDSKKDKKEYVELLLKYKAIREKERFDRSDSKSVEKAMEVIFKRLDELAAL